MTQFLWIKDGAPELRDASHLWGQGVLETRDRLREETGEPLARTACIGPAGEKLVRYACVIQDLKGAAGRTGVGAVMGSKKLKAIVVKGSRPPAMADRDTVLQLGKWMSSACTTLARNFHEFGTGAEMVAFNLAGNTPTRNFRDGFFENTEAIDARVIKKTIRIGMEGCYACAVRCKKVVEVEDPWIVSPKYGGPEYETLAAYGSNCGVGDLEALARAHHLSQHYGLDTISTGVSIGFAMECFESGYLAKADFDGLEPTFGNANAMLALLEMIGERRGIGDLLAEGTKRAAEQIGNGATAIAHHVKGVEIGMHDPRYKQGLGLGMAVSENGGDHACMQHDTMFEREGPSLTMEGKPLGLLDPMPAGELSTRKAFLVSQLRRWRLAQDSLVYCIFVPWTYDQIVQLVRATTGWDTSLEELMLVGERAITMGRVFNVREGITSADDGLPKRFFSPPLNGDLAEKQQAVDPEKLAAAIRDYYFFMGWDRTTGVPEASTLVRLGLDWAANDLVKH